MTPGEIRNRLTEHLKALHGNHRQLYLGDIAAHILANPQAHIDALVEAGVLYEPTEHDHFRKRLYAVVRPHRHEWFVRGVADGKHGEVDAEVFVKCDCGQGRWIPNRPLEVPS